MKTAMLTVLSFVLLLPLPEAARAQSTEALNAAGQLVVSSGLASQIKSYPKQIEDEISQSRGNLPDGMFEALRDSARIGFNAVELQRNITQHLAVNMAIADIEQALAWLESDTGRRLTRVEEEAAASLSPQVLQDYFAAYQKQPPSPRRTELVVGLIEATRAVEHAAHTVENIALGIAVGMDAAQPVQNRIGVAQLRERLQTMLPPAQLRAQMAGILPVAFAYTYRNTSDVDLGQYLDFNRSPLGRRYNDAVMLAFIDTLTRASIGMGPLIEQAMRKKST